MESSEIERQLAEMERSRQELLAQLAEAKRLEKESKIIDVTIWTEKVLVKVKLSEHREDIVNAIRFIPSRYYDSFTQTNTFAIKYYPEIEKNLSKLSNINIKLNDTSKEYLDYIINGPDYKIGMDSKYITVKIKPTVYTSYLTSVIQTAKIDEKKDIWMVPKTEGWRLFDFLANKKFESDEVTLEFLKQQKARRDSLAEIAKLESVDYPHDSIQNIEPRDFQLVGSAFADAAGKAIIADVMGLGKSIQFIMVCEKNNYRALIVCPSGLALNWMEEIKKDTGKDAYVISMTSPEPFHFVDMLVEKKHQYTIITYEAIARAFVVDESKPVGEQERNMWSDLINASKFDIIGVDESQKIKNMESGRSKGVRMIQPEKIVFLTGTPVMNRPGELFPMLNMIDPIQFNSYQRFMNNYSDGKNGVRNVDELRELLKPIMIRRLKSDVVKELPPISRMVRYHELSPKAKKLVKKIMAGIYEDMNGKNVNITHVLAQITRLKQVCAIDKAESTADLAVSIVDENEGQPYNKVLIGSQFLNVVHSIAKYLGNEALVIEGSTPMEKRMEIVKEFQTNPTIKFLVCSTMAVQEGLNITAAGTVINNDLLWTPAAHEQFEGRAYGRMSDSHGVDSYYRVTKDSIETWVFSLLFEKAQTIDMTVDGKEAESVGNNSIANGLINMIKQGRKI